MRPCTICVACSSVAAPFYRSVFDGCLGFSLSGSVYQLPPYWLVTWNTDEAEETFQVFDHPVVYIFQRNIASDEDAQRVWEQCLSR